MHKYKLDTGLWAVKEHPEFATDQEAWEYLRVKLPSKFATLYRWTAIPVPINHRQRYLNSYNAKYTHKLNADSTHEERHLWMPVLSGITDDPYLVEEPEPEVCLHRDIEDNLHRPSVCRQCGEEL
jgi:hypothetical protein